MDDRLTLHWSPWYLLWGAGANRAIPTQPGLYRVRRIGLDGVDYIGQTGIAGRGLRGRLGMLLGVYAAEMPYADPHTAAPALWALRHATGCDFEASVAVAEGTAQWRKGLEALAIALYRQERGESPTVEFGRVPAGHRGSSGNNARLVAAGKRVRGGPTVEATVRNLRASRPPARSAGTPRARPGAATGGLLGSRWSWWLAVSRHEGSIGCGRPKQRASSIIGQGLIGRRVATHLAKSRTSEQTQGAIFAARESLQASWVAADQYAAHQLLELESDLIAAHLLATGEVPAAQFLG